MRLLLKIGVFSVVLSIIYGCGPVSRQIVESMDSEDRKEIISNETDFVLCNQYRFVSGKTKIAIENELSKRNIGICVVNSDAHKNPNGGELTIRIDGIISFKDAAIPHVEADSVDPSDWCSVDCSGDNFSNRKLMDALYKIKSWQDLVDQVAFSGYKSRRTYYYLGVSLYNLGFPLIAKGIINKSLLIKRCHSCDENYMAESAAETLKEIHRKIEGVHDWDIAKDKNTLNAYSDFIKNYPDSSYVGTAYEKIDWLHTKKENSEVSYYAFKNKHPDSEMVDKARSEAFRLVDKNNKEELVTFMDRWPMSSDDVLPKLKLLLKPEIDYLSTKHLCDEAEKLAEIMNKVREKYYLFDKVQCEINKMVLDGKESGTSRKLYLLGMQYESEREYSDAKKIYKSIAEEFPDGEYAVSASERMLSIDREQAKEQRDKEKAALMMMQMLQKAQAEEAAERRAEDAERAANKRAKEAIEAAERAERDRRSREYSRCMDRKREGQVSSCSY